MYMIFIDNAHKQKIIWKIEIHFEQKFSFPKNKNKKTK